MTVFRYELPGAFLIITRKRQAIFTVLEEQAKTFACLSKIEQTGSIDFRSRHHKPMQFPL